MKEAALIQWKYAETTLDKYVKSFDLSDDIKLNCIRQILHIMTEVHKRNIIHRDISANNIFVISGTIKIADFGLGKTLNVFTSHQTMHTNDGGTVLLLCHQNSLCCSKYGG